jgi:hypothetical protein
MALREQIIKLAKENSELRKHLIPLLKTAMEFPTQKALKKYLDEHPDADKSLHKVVETKGESKYQKEQDRKDAEELATKMSQFPNIKGEVDFSGGAVTYTHQYANGKPAFVSVRKVKGFDDEYLLTFYEEDSYGDMEKIYTKKNERFDLDRASFYDIASRILFRINAVLENKKK